MSKTKVAPFEVSNFLALATDQDRQATYVISKLSVKVFVVFIPL